MADGILSGLRSGMSDARDSAEDMSRRGAKRLRRTASDLRDQGDDVRGELGRLWSQLEDLVESRVKPAASQGASAARYYGRQGRDAASDATDRLVDATRAQPLLALGIAIAATWFISGMLRSRR